MELANHLVSIGIQTLYFEVSEFKGTMILVWINLGLN